MPDASGLAGLAGWIDEGHQISKEYRFDGFPDAIAFVVRIASAAEKANHHPDLEIHYNRVRVALRTHDADAVTEADFALARQIESFHGA